MPPPPSRFTPPGPLGFGGAPLGNMFAAVDEETAEGALTAAWEGGLRHFDTAPLYGYGLSEHRFGRVLRRHPRDAFVLSTKVGRLLDPDLEAPRAAGDGPGGSPWGPFIGGLPFRPRYDYTAAGAERSLEASLQRLGLARIDIAYIHDVAEDMHGDAWEEQFAIAMAGAARRLSELRAAGVIRAWGLGVNRVEACRRALEEADPDVFLLAGRYSLLDCTEALERLFPACAARGVTVVVGGPYNSGLLAGGSTFEYREATPELIAARDRLAGVAAAHGVDLRAAALQFSAAHPVVAAVIPGAKTAAKVRQNLALMQAPIPAAFWQELKHQGLLPAGAPVPVG